MFIAMVQLQLLACISFLIIIKGAVRPLQIETVHVIGLPKIISVIHLALPN